MSGVNLADEKFGDISQFVSLERSTGAPKPTSGATYATTSINASSNEGPGYDYNETSTLNANSDFGLSPFINLQRSKNQVEESETEDKLESLSGPEIWSGLDSWGNSEQGSCSGIDSFYEENDQNVAGNLSDGEKLQKIGNKTNNSGYMANDACLETDIIASTETENIQSDKVGMKDEEHADKCDNVDNQETQTTDVLQDTDFSVENNSKTVTDNYDGVPDTENISAQWVKFDGNEEELVNIDLRDKSYSEENNTSIDSNLMNDDNNNGNENSLKENELDHDKRKFGDTSVEYLNAEDSATDKNKPNDAGESLNSPSFLGEIGYLDNDNVSTDELCPDSELNTNDLERSKLDDDNSMERNDNNITCNDNESIKSLWSDIDLEDEDDDSNKSEHGDQMSISNLKRHDSSSEGSQENGMVVEMNLDNDTVLDIREEGLEKGWTILEVWCSFALMCGALPYWITNDGRTTTIKRNIATNMLWTISALFYAVEIFNVFPKLALVLDGEREGKSYLFLGIHVAFAVFRISYIPVAVFKSKYLKKANDRLLLFPRGRMTNLRAGICFVLLTSFAVANLIIFIRFQTELKLGFSDVNTMQVFIRLECFGRMYLTMSRNCTHLSNYSNEGMIWGAVGFGITAHEILTEIVACLGIIVACSTLFYTTYDIEGNEVHDPNSEFAHVTSNDLTIIENMANELSHFIGELLAGYLLYNATETAKMMLLIFFGGSSVLFVLVFRHGTVFIGLFIASWAAIRINRISEAISSRVNANPRQRRPGTAILFAYIHDMIFKKSIGIGVAGVFVITLKVTMSYLGLIGTLITLAA